MILFPSYFAPLFETANKQTYEQTFKRSIIVLRFFFSLFLLIFLFFLYFFAQNIYYLGESICYSIPFFLFFTSLLFFLCNAHFFSNNKIIRKITCFLKHNSTNTVFYLLKIHKKFLLYCNLFNFFSFSMFPVFFLLFLFRYTS